MGCVPSRPAHARRRIALGMLRPLGPQPTSDECLVWRPMRGPLPAAAAQAGFLNVERAAFFARVAVREGVLPASAAVRGKPLFDGTDGAFARAPRGHRVASPYYEALRGPRAGWVLSFKPWAEGAPPPPSAVITGRLPDGTPLFSGFSQTNTGAPVTGAAQPGACAAALADGTTALLHCVSVLCAQRLGSPRGASPFVGEPAAPAEAWGWQVISTAGVLVAAGLLWGAAGSAAALDDADMDPSKPRRGRYDSGLSPNYSEGGGGWVDTAGAPVTGDVFCGGGNMGGLDDSASRGGIDGGWGSADNGGSAGGGDTDCGSGGGGDSGGGGGDGGGGGGDGGGGGGGGGD